MNERDTKVMAAAQSILVQIRQLTFGEALDALTIANSLLNSSENELNSAQRQAQQAQYSLGGIAAQGKALC